MNIARRLKVGITLFAVAVFAPLTRGQVMNQLPADALVVFKVNNPEQGILPFALRAANPDWRPLIPEWDEMSKNVIGQALPDVLAGRRTAGEALTAIVPRLESMLRYGGWIGKAAATGSTKGGRA